jgi:hypothetical protein
MAFPFRTSRTMTRSRGRHELNGRAAEQRDAADEGRLDACGSIIVGNEAIVNRGKVVRPSQLIASVRRTRRGSVEGKQG